MFRTRGYGVNFCMRLMKTLPANIIIYCIQILFLLSIASCFKVKSIDFAKKEFSEENLKKYSNGELLEYLTLSSIIWHFDKAGRESGIEYQIRDELIVRKATNDLILAFNNPIDWCQMQYVIEALSEIDDPKIIKIFKRSISKKTTKNNFHCLNYLAKKGDFAALKVLNDNYNKYPVSSVEWAEAVKWFGVYKYKPSIPNLIKSLDAASGNVGCAAFVCLAQFFDGPHPEFESIEETTIYFTKLYKNLK